ncbi:Protein RFT1 [Amphibalanus amphitrite]|uniref:Protein RFT1 homolog n=1 Tax=Amphibalanus amphitrite TaxID=1232801 RepID=A0A6A4V8Q1_AMPAM|nr:Protein RFT1 [Amphibalanus amphitrite]
MRLALLYSTATFVSVEAFRRAALGVTESSKWRQAINLVWLSVPVSAAVSAALAGLWLHALSQPAPEVTSDYRLGVWVTAAMVALETAAQPLVILAQAMLFVKLKVVADMVSLCSRVALKAWLIALYPSHAIWAYCVGHAVSSALLVVIYYGTLLWHPALDRDQLALTWSFFKQGLLKQLLTEGERYLMTAFHLLDFSEQGLYDVVANLGSLAARFLFQPIEENAYVYFSRTVERGKPVSAAAGRVLHDLLRAMSLLGLVAVTFGWSYSHLLLRLYGGALLAAGPAVSLLRAQCAYVLLLAVNGVLECYTFAVMRQEQINGYNRKMLPVRGRSAAEPAVSVPPLLGLRPPAAVAAALVTAGLLAAGSESRLYPSSAAAHVAVGALCGAAVVAAAVYSEPRLLQAARERVGDKLKRS